MHRTFLSALFALFLQGAFAGGPAAGGPITWSFNAVTAADGSIQLALTATCEQGWHIYALTLPRDDGPFPTVIRMKNSPAYAVAGAIQEPPPEESDDPNFQMTVRYHTGHPSFTVPVKRLSNDAFELAGEVEFMACNDRTCLPPEIVKFSVPVPALK